MARVRGSGTTIVIQSRGKKLRFIGNCLSKEYGLKIDGDDHYGEEIFLRLGLIIGLFRKEQERPTTRAVLAKLEGLERAIGVIEEMFAIERGGLVLVEPAGGEAWRRIADALTQAPTLGEREAARKFLVDELDRLELIRHASLIARYGLKEIKGEKGRDPLIWYDALVALLVEVAENLGISPVLSYDRAKNRPVGAFYRMAELSESLLPKEMRSPSHKARLRRLERAMARLEKNKNRNRKVRFIGV